MILQEHVKLKPCPFCGTEPRRKGTSGLNDWYVECPQCHISTIPTAQDNFPEEAWNMRHGERALTPPEDLQNPLAIVKAIIALTNAGKKVVFDEDMGTGSITIFVGDNHTHCGYPEAEESVLIKNMADTLTGKGGLSWA